MANTGLIRPNPALQRGFNNESLTTPSVGTETMTINGTVGLTALLLFVVIAAGAFSWLNFGMGVAIVAALIGFGLAIFTAFKPMKAQVTAIPYAIAEGVFLGAISRVYNEAYSGIVLTAAGLTVAILVAMLAVYRSGLIKVTQNFKIAIAAATGGVALLYLATIGLSFFGINMPLVNSNSTFGILFSVAVVILAAASLAVDFDFIEQGAEQGLPKQMEWYGAFGLIVTLVWLYLELLRLLSKLQSRD